MAQKNPIAAELLNLAELNHAEKQAALDLERARYRKTIGGQQAIPTVAMTLAENAEKRRKKAEQIQKQGEKSGPSPQSMLPPMVEPTGQTRSTGAAGSAKAITELAGVGISGGGPQPAMQGGGGGVVGNMLGAGMSAAGATAPTPTQGATTQTAPQGGVPQGVPTSTTSYIPADEPLKRRLFRASLNVLGSRIGGGNLGSVILPEPGGTSVTTRIPTTSEQAEQLTQEAAKEASGFSALMREGEDKIGTKEAGEIGKRIVSNIQAVKEKYGERGEAVVEEMVRMSGLLNLQIEQEQQLKLEQAAMGQAMVQERQMGREARAEARKAADPEEQVRDEEARILLKTKRGEEITPDDRAFLNERARLDPLKRIENEVMRGMSMPEGSKAATQADADTAWGDLSRTLGREPTAFEIKQELLRRGLSVP